MPNPFAGGVSNDRWEGSMFGNGPVEELGSGGLNPFAALFGSRGPGGGQRAEPIGGGAGGGAGAAAASPGRRAYSPIFDPNAPGWRGFIGSAMGNPTRDEYQQGIAGDARARAMSKLGEMIQSGVAPQKAVMDFINTPDGVNFLTTSSDPGGEMKSFLAQVAPGPEKGTVVGAGDALVGETSGRVLFRQPPTPIQEFTGMSELANLSSEEREAMAKATMAKELSGDMTAQEGALSRLVQQGKLSRETADMLIGDVLTTMPILDDGGKTVGHAVVNKVGGTVQMLPAPPAGGALPAPGDTEYAPGLTPGTRPEDPPQQVDLPAMYQGMPNPADIVDGAGPVGLIAETGGGLLGNLFPGLAGEEYRQKRNALRQIRNDVTMLAAATDRMNGDEVKKAQQIVENLGVMTNPTQAAQSLIDWHDFLDNKAEIWTNEASNPATTADVRTSAHRGLLAIKAAKANLPPKAGLTAKRDALAKEAPLERVTNEIEGGVVEAQKGIEGALPPPPAGATPATPGTSPTAAPATPKVFASQADVVKAFGAGTVKIGDLVTIGDQTFKVEP